MSRPALPRTTALASAGAVSACAAATLVIRDPHGSGSFGTCPSLLATGLYCPGCGSLRAVHDTLTGNLGEAFAHNPFTPLVMVWLVWWWVSELAASTGRRVPGPPRSSRFAGALAVAFIVFAVLRNFPGTGLAP